MHTQQNTALLIFARSPESEARVKGFHPKSYRRSYRIAQRLLQHTRRQARASGLPVFIIDEKQQTGVTFGERLANAMEYIWQVGYEQLIVIGSDNPNLTATQLRQAEHRLRSSSWILGPADDGGTWLIGLHRHLYDRTTWMQLPWLTARVFSTLRNYLQDQHASGAVLAKAIDLDHTGDLQVYLSIAKQWKKLWNLLADLLRPNVRVLFTVPNPGIRPKSGILSLRGPPSPTSVFPIIRV